MAALVPVTVGAAAKTLPTVCAGERFLSSMRALVAVKVRAPGEAFATDGALIGLLTTMQPAVTFQHSSGTKPSPTFRALMRLGFSIMEALMGGQQGSRCKGFAAVPAAMGVGPGVDLLVLLQVGARGEPLAAVPTFIDLFSFVALLVSLQVGAPPETLIAVRTLVRLPTSVIELVLGQRGGVPESLGAFRTGVWLVLAVGAPVLEKGGTPAKPPPTF